MKFTPNMKRYFEESGQDDTCIFYDVCDPYHVRIGGNWINVIEVSKKTFEIRTAHSMMALDEGEVVGPFNLEEDDTIEVYCEPLTIFR